MLVFYKYCIAAMFWGRTLLWVGIIIYEVNISQRIFHKFQSSVHSIFVLSLFSTITHSQVLYNCIIPVSYQAHIIISQSSVHSKWRFFYHLFPTGLLRYASPRDGQTLLHRAAEGCLPDNVTLLLHTDEELANIQDNYGNTALQIACTKAHKPTVKAFLVRAECLIR